MKAKILILATAAAAALCSCSVMQNLNSERLMQGGVYIAQALTLTDDQVVNYVHQYITQLDAQSQIMP